VTFENYESIFGQLVGLLERGIGLSQGHNLHRTTQHIKMQTYIHASSAIRNHDRSVSAVEDRTCLRPHGRWDRLTHINVDKSMKPKIFVTS